MKNKKAYLLGYNGKYRDLSVCDDVCYLKVNINLDGMKVDAKNDTVAINIKKLELKGNISENITVHYNELCHITNDELYFNDNSLNQGTILHFGSDNKYILVVYSGQAKLNIENQNEQYCRIQITKLIELNDDLAKKYKNIKIIDVMKPLQNDIEVETE